jgi:amino acid adenylation domain-containing protein
VAQRLRQLGIGPEMRVGICLERSAHMLAAVLGVLKAGGAYVPLDPAFPRQRLAMMIEDAAPRAIITQRTLAGVLPAAPASLVYADELGSGGDGDLPPASVNADQAAYVLFTSGSTGRPKGVVIAHRMLVNFLFSMRRKPGLSAADRLVAVTTLSFDIAGLELLLPLTVGAAVVIATTEEASDPAQLQRLLDQHGATVMQATPATWQMLLDSGWAGRRSLRAFCGGEALTRELADRLLPQVAELWNLYGPTETTIWSSMHRIAPDGEAVAIGRPIANTRMYILDGRLCPMPVGATGELYIAGAGVARGYLYQPGLTAERFIPDPFSRRPGERMYRTGDLARWRSDGTIQCLGRVDHQVKIRGFRIELGEIESALVQHASVRQVIVTDYDDSAGGKRLVAYWIPDQNPASTSDELGRHLRAILPQYMVPSAFVQLPAFPLTPNGKIDRQALPAPGADRGDSVRVYVAPSGREEEALAQIWSQLLGRAPIGAHDHFFELGGHSLLATRLVSKVRETLGVTLPLRAVFDAPVLVALAERIRSAQPADATADDIASEVEEGQI